MNKSSETPLMAQYHKIKAKHPDTILLFRVGDFYETFLDDAKTCSSVLGITLTKRSNGAAGNVPLAGFPYHAIDNYLPKLVSAGIKVAIVEQLEDPKKTKKLVKRDVVEVVTPGMTVSDQILDQKSNNYLAAIAKQNDLYGVAFTDISTGEFYCYQGPANRISDVIETIQPKEVIVEKAWDKSKVIPYRCYETRIDDWIFNFDYGFDLIKDHFKVKSLKSFGIDDQPLAVIAAGAALHYLKENQKDKLQHIKQLAVFNPEDYIILDPSTKRNLELIATIQDGKSSGTLFSIIDKTQTAMGGRLLKKWIFQPLKDPNPINQRLEAVSELISEAALMDKISAQLSNLGDLERFVAKISMNKINPRELMALHFSLKEIPYIKSALESVDSMKLKSILGGLDSCEDVADLIASTLTDDPPVNIGDGNLIRSGINAELDEYKGLARSGKSWILDCQQQERELTGIPNLKINYNNVFGYYIEITKSKLAQVPEHYIRKQTLVNAERYITPELKEKEEKLLAAEEKIQEIEQELFLRLKENVFIHKDRIQKTAANIAELDCLLSYATISKKYKYNRPVVDHSDGISITEGRHPVIEQLLPPGEDYIPNNTFLNTSSDQILIITGPNMSGKSSYLRQVGLIVLLAQIGCYVPAEKAHIGVVDKIFTRVGASDNLAAGESTFLVEMNESAMIINNATSRSLILFDEIGRGTSTYDGLSIAWSLCEYLHESGRYKPRTLFATHYHELNELESMYSRIKNYNVEVREYGDKVIFLRKIIPGGADHSYGIHVAQMAGLPDDIILRAKSILQSLEAGTFLTSKDSSSGKESTREAVQMTLFQIDEKPIIQSLLKLDVNRIAPVEALLKLSELVSMAKTSIKNKKD